MLTIKPGVECRTAHVSNLQSLEKYVIHADDQSRDGWRFVVTVCQPVHRRNFRFLSRTILAKFPRNRFDGGEISLIPSHEPRELPS